MLSSSSSEEDSSEEDALEVSRTADALFDAPRHSVEDWAYGDYDRRRRGKQQQQQAEHAEQAEHDLAAAEMFLASEVPIPEIPAWDEGAGGKKSTKKRSSKRRGKRMPLSSSSTSSLRRSGRKQRAGKKIRVKVRIPGSTSASRLKHHTRPPWGSPNKKNKLPGRRKAAAAAAASASSTATVPKRGKHVKKRKQKKQQPPAFLEFGSATTATAANRKKKITTATAKKRNRKARSSATTTTSSSSPTRMTVNMSHVNVHVPHHASSPVRHVPPSVSRLNISNLDKMSAARGDSENNNNRLNRSMRSVGSARSARSTRSTRSLGRSWTASGRLATPRKSRESNTVKSLRLRLSGTHNTIRALQEQLHERTAEVEELRAQLLTKTRALEATRSFANVSISGSMNASFVARASCSSNGLEAQSRRKYEAKVEQVSRECDEAIADTRRQLHRATEINGELRRELEKVRDAYADAKDRHKETHDVLRETKRALSQEKKFAAELALEGGGEGEIGLGGAGGQGGDLSGPGASVRTLRLEVKRLRTLLSQADAVHSAHEAQAVAAALAKERLGKENAIQRKRGRAQAAELAARVGLSSSSVNHNNRRPPRSSSSSSSVSKKNSSPPANTQHPDAVRFAKLKKMFDRAQARTTGAR